MWTIMVRSYPMLEDFCWEHDIPYFTRKAEAIKEAEKLQKIWSQPDGNGHKYYKAKFYAEKITEEYIAAKQHRWAMEMASRM